MRKIDEQISYNWLFFLLAGAFGAVTFWAVYDETATRREYKGYQETFFQVQTTLAKQAWDQAKAQLEHPVATAPKGVAAEEWQKVLARSAEWTLAKAQLKQLQEDLKSPKKAEEYKAAQAKLQELQFIRDDKQQNYTFTKSNLDEAYYFYTKAKHELDPQDKAMQREFDERKKRYDEFREQLAKDEVVMNEAATVYDCLKKGRSPERPQCEVMSAADYAVAGFQGGGRTVAVDAYTDTIGKLEKQVEDLERPTKELERKYQAALIKSGAGPMGLFGPDTEVLQQNLEELGRVDRCESCHVGSNRGGFEMVEPKYFRSHPYRRTLLAIHPVEKFGCTTCHDGQGRATTRFYAHAPTNDHHYAEKHFWEYPLLRDHEVVTPQGKAKARFVESECRQCHRQEFDLRANLQCETDAECPKEAPKCGPLAEPLNPSANLAMGIEPKVEGGKYCGTPNTEDEAKVDASLVELAPHLARGRRVIEEVACYGCHPIEGYENRPKAGPDLRHAASKLNPAWMAQWILNPRAFRPNTRMPNFFPERLNTAGYPENAKPKYTDGFAEIMKVRESDPEKRARVLNSLMPERFQPEQQAAILTSFLVANSEPFASADDDKSIPVGDATRGEKLVDTLGCYGCHTMTRPGEKRMEHPNRASHFDNGPDLGNVGAKTSRAWIYGWVKNPKAFAPETRMPNLRLSDQEAADIATFLAGNKFVGGQPKEYTATAGIDPNNADYRQVGKKLLNYYGCYGCHLVKGFEQTPGIGAELTEFGVKEVSRLDYGDYVSNHAQQTWEKWIENKLEHPRVYRYERVDTRMPEFGLAPQEIADVMVVLKGMRGRTKDNDVLGHRLTGIAAEREQGRQLVRYYNCNGCHTFDGRTGDIRALEAYTNESETTGPRFAPPVISGEGAKTHPTWLFGFLRKPMNLRPHLTVRMPTFGFSDPEATSLVAMFSALDGAPFPWQPRATPPLEGARKAQAETAFKAAQCTQCHTLGDSPSPEMAMKGAPNLLLTKDRLRPDWVARWIRDPQLLYHGVNMPSFFTGGANPLVGAAAAEMTKNLPGIAELAKMSGADVIYLLRDLLMTLETGSKQSVRTAAIGTQHASR